jgi:hypothetical protein
VEQRDRHGTLVVEAEFAGDGALARAWVRIPDGSWVGVEPRATREAPWGLSDRAWHAPRGGAPRGARPPSSFAGLVPLTVFESIDWRRPDRIVPGAEPARLPPGAAPAVFNLIATLAAAQGVGALPYAGPYPSEALFLGLLEAFHYTPEMDDPLGAFQAGELRWVPAPHEPLFAADDLYVQLRGRIEKVVWRGLSYHRPDWGRIVRHAPRRVRDAGDGVRCGLWALGRPLVDHLDLAPDGELRRVLAPSPTPGSPEPRTSPAAPPEPDLFPAPGEPAPRVTRAPSEVWAGVVAVVIAESLAPLARPIRDAAADLVLEWAPLERDLARVEQGRVRVDTRLHAALRDGLAAAPDARTRAGLALACLAEIAGCVGDALRARAQERLASGSEAEQRAALEALGERHAAGPDEARAITTALAALLAGPS